MAVPQTNKINIESIIQKWIVFMKLRQYWLNDAACYYNLKYSDSECGDRLAIPLQLVDAAINRVLREEYESERWAIILSLTKYLKPAEVVKSVEMVTKSKVDLNTISYDPQSDPDFIELEDFIRRNYSLFGNTCSSSEITYK